MDDIQTLFRSLMNTLHECWYMNEQRTANYNASFISLLKKYHKISWEEECDMVMDKTYFDCVNDPTKPVPKSVYYTHQLHLILCELPKHWLSVVAFYNDKEQKKAAETFNRYVKLYNEFEKKPKTD